MLLLGAEVASEDSSQEGIELQTVYFPEMGNMQVRFVQRDDDDLELFFFFSHRVSSRT